MSRPPRRFVPGVAQHVIQRGNNRSPCFASDSDCGSYLTLLEALSRETNCAIHSFALMPNHVHILLTPGAVDAPSRMMKRLAQRYSALFNRKYARTGALWDGRFRAYAVDTDEYVVTCYRYIELNPVRASLVERPDAYKWSSHRANTGKGAMPWLAPHPSFLALATASRSAALAYRALFDAALNEDIVRDIRAGKTLRPVSDTVSDTVTLP